MSYHVDQEDLLRFGADSNLGLGDRDDGSRHLEFRVHRPRALDGVRRKVGHSPLENLKVVIHQ